MSRTKTRFGADRAQGGVAGLAAREVLADHRGEGRAGSEDGQPDPARTDGDPLPPGASGIERRGEGVASYLVLVQPPAMMLRLDSGDRDAGNDLSVSQLANEGRRQDEVVALLAIAARAADQELQPHRRIGAGQAVHQRTIGIPVESAPPEARERPLLRRPAPLFRAAPSGSLRFRPARRFRTCQAGGAAIFGRCRRNPSSLACPRRSRRPEPRSTSPGSGRGTGPQRC